MSCVILCPSFRSQSIVVPFGCKTSWKSKQIARSEAKAMKALEKEVKEAVQKEREVGMQQILWSEIIMWDCTLGKEEENHRKAAEENGK